MDDKEIKQIRKIIFHQMKTAEERLESAAIIIEREANVDAIPILFKAVEITTRTLLAFKQKPLGGYQENINSLQQTFKKEGLFDEETIKSFHSLYEMNNFPLSDQSFIPATKWYKTFRQKSRERNLK